MYMYIHTKDYIAILTFIIITHCSVADPEEIGQPRAGSVG